MSDHWNLIIYSAEKFWIMKEKGTLSEYVVMERPVGLFGNGRPIEYFKAANDETAIQKGLQIAKTHGF